jgi:hypothetical protein
MRCKAPFFSLSKGFYSAQIDVDVYCVIATLSFVFFIPVRICGMAVCQPHQSECGETKVSWLWMDGREHQKNGSVSKPCTPGEHQNSW